MSGKPRKNPVTDQQIIEAYRQCPSAYKVATMLGIGGTTVYRVLKTHGIDRTGMVDDRKRRMRFQGQEQEIAAWYADGKTLHDIRVLLGTGSDYAIKHAVRRAGGTLRPNPIPTLKDGELEQIRTLHVSGLGQVDISLQLGRSQSFVSRVMRKYAIAPHTAQSARHSNWKGGRFLTGEGYVRIWVDKEDPLQCMANNSSHVLEHRLVMARALGRPLTTHETVHHINGNRADNRLENLELRQGKHGRGIRMVCLACGAHNVAAQELTASTITED